MSEQEVQGMSEQSEAPARAMTVRQLARLLGVAPTRVRGWIKSGQLRALNLASSPLARPRMLILPDDWEAFRRAHAAVPEQPPKRRRRKVPCPKDYYPD